MDSLNAQIAKARVLLDPPPGTATSPWAALAASFLAASAAVLMAGMVILGPGVVIDDPRAASAAVDAPRAR